MKKQFLILMLAIQASCSYNHKKDVAEDPNNVALAEETALSEGETYAHPDVRRWGYMHFRGPTCQN